MNLFGPKINFKVVESPGGVEPWLNRHPPKRASWRPVIIMMCAAVSLCGGIMAGVFWALQPSNPDSAALQSEYLPTMLEITEEITPELIVDTFSEVTEEITADLDEISAETATVTPTATRGIVISTSQGVIVYPTNTPYPTYTPYPTPRPVIINQSSPPIVITAPPVIIHEDSPPIVITALQIITATPIPTDTLQPNATDTPTATPSPTLTAAVTLFPTFTPGGPTESPDRLPGDLVGPTITRFPENNQTCPPVCTPELTPNVSND
jgi:hypothetical protein